MNKAMLCVGLTAMLSTAVLPKGVDPETVVSFSDRELVLCVRTVKPITEDDRILMAKLLYVECRGESAECQSGICSVLYNRYRSGKYMSMSDVIYEDSQFAADNLDAVDGDKLTDLLRIVDDIIDNGPTLPAYVIYFRANEYHTFSDAHDFVKIDDTCFSYSRKLYKKYERE